MITTTQCANKNHNKNSEDKDTKTAIGIEGESMERGKQGKQEDLLLWWTEFWCEWKMTRKQTHYPLPWTVNTTRYHAHGKRERDTHTQKKTDKRSKNKFVFCLTRQNRLCTFRIHCPPPTQLHLRHTLLLLLLLYLLIKTKGLGGAWGSLSWLLEEAKRNNEPEKKFWSRSRKKRPGFRSSRVKD